MATPIINIVSVSKNRLSNKSGADVITVTFTSNQNLIKWEARADSTTGQGSGQYIDGSEGMANFNSLDFMTFDQLEDKQWTKGAQEVKDFLFLDFITWDTLDTMTFDDLLFIVKAGTQYTFEVDNEELQWGDKSYRIDVYGMNEGGEWTPYGG